MRIAYTGMVIGSAASFAEIAYFGSTPFNWFIATLSGTMIGLGIDVIVQAIRKPEVTSKANLKAKDKADPRSSFERGVLPCCGGTEFYNGPHGGMSVNLECANPACKQRWNVAFFDGQCIQADRI